MYNQGPFKVAYVITYDHTSEQQGGSFAKSLTNGEVICQVQGISKKCSSLVFKRVFLNDRGQNGNPDWYLLRLQDVVGSVNKEGKASDRIMAVTREDTLSNWYIYLQDREGGVEVKVDKVLTSLKFYFELPNGDPVTNMNNMNFNIEFDLVYSSA